MSVGQSVPANTGSCLNAEEAALVQQVNAYRQSNGRAALPASYWLSTTGQWHAWDLTANAPYGGSCTLHSWSTARPALWQAVCYTADHVQAAQMWAKPRQISQGTPPGAAVYTGRGYENAAQAGSQISASVALALWQSSQAHRDVILQQGAWAGVSFQGLGVGVVGGHAVLWFGDGVDPTGTMPPCAESPTIFSTGFE